MRRYMITSALPYANGPIHIGHLAGAYLPADIFTRFLRLKGEDVIHICGTDEHGVAITLRAVQEGISPKELVDKYHERIKSDFEKFGISFDHFSRTSTPLHHRNAQNFFLKLHDKGYLYKRSMKQYYDPKMGRFLPDRYVVGTCPYCGYEDAKGDQCERCGRQIEPGELKDPRSALSGEPVILKDTVHWFFKLSDLKEPLREYVSSKDWKPFVKEFALSWIEELRDRAITRDLEWGVPVPLDDPDAKGKVLYVWFDAPIGYISATMEWASQVKGDPDAWKPYWMDPETVLVHFIGKDNIVFHTVIWPAMLYAHGDYILPTDVPANAFLNLQGRKLSTSKGYAIWADELVESVGQDIARYAVALYIPEKNDSDFNVREAFTRTNAELVDNFGNFAQRVLSFINRYMDGRVPEPKTLTEEDERLLKLLRETAKRYEELMLRYEIRLALREAVNLGAEANRYYEHQAPWKLRKGDPDRASTVLYVAFQILRGLSAMFYPYVPASVRRLWGYMNVSPESFSDLTTPNPDLAGHPIGRSEPLYRKVDEDKIRQWEEELRRRAEGREPESKGAEPRIGYEDFAKVKLRVAKVLSAERIPKTDKLLKLTIDLGDERRTLVAGLGHVYEPEDLVGKSIVVVANLQPKKLRGVLSDGMLLAAHDEEGKPVILTVEREVPPGSEVS
ncbi:MAG: methionine--tRNA ligase [Thermotogae bacterium]|nr:methionine--tRNA ligase [Thermotogota bacterium]